jgi:carotenoid cleavage dioxygenase-like enzyme
MTATDSQAPWHLRGNWAPMLSEITDHTLRVEGTIPPALNGVYARTGPNPATGSSAHWFFGDGMVHGIRLANGRAEWYRNRFVQTPNIATPDDNPMASMGNLARGTANTAIHVHNGQILCTEEGHWPWQIDGELNTVGYQNYDGKLTCSMTAHPKICPVTGELIAFSYLAPEAPFLRYIRISAEGVVQQIEGIEIPNMVMMHDFNVTRNYVIFMDLPVCFDLDALASSGLPFRFNRSAGARLGVMPRNGTNADVRWFDIEPCYVFHPVNAHDDGDKIVLHVSRQLEAFGAHADDYAEVGRLWKWTINLTNGTVTEEQIDDRPGDFGRVDTRMIGLDAKHGYLMSMGGEGNSEEPVFGSQLWKYDLHSGECSEHQLGDTTRGGEPVFAPAPDGTADDEGWVMSIVHDERSGRSRLIIVDAQNFSAPPVATIELPQRVPYGAHGTWIADTDLQTS